MAKIEEFEDPKSRYQNPRYSGKGVPDRANDPRRKPKYVFELHGSYSHGNWDHLTTEETRSEINKRADDYRNNTKGYLRLKVKKVKDE